MGTKKIAYLANVRIPTEKAHGLQIMKTCEALALQGASVELVVPKRRNKLKDDPFTFYGVKKNFTMLERWCLDFLWLPLPRFLKTKAFWKQTMTFAFSVWLYARRQSDAVFYTRDAVLLAVLPKRASSIYEVHTLPQKPGKMYRWLLARTAHIVAITEGLKNDIVTLGISPERITVLPDAVDAKQFAIKESIVECRERLHLPLDRHIVVYTGHLYPWKGADTVLAAAEKMPDVTFLFVGGMEDDVQKFRAQALAQNISNAMILGIRPPRDIPWYLRSADVLVLPNSGKETISSRYTSPMKLFEYMAAGRPIGASDLPSIREILSEEIATFFMPDNADSLVATLTTLLGPGAAVAEEKAVRAQTLASSQYTWEKRAERILGII